MVDQCCGKSKILGRPTDHPWLMVEWSVSVLGGPSIIYWDHEMIKSIKELVKIRQSVFTLYSDTSTNRHTDGFLQDCSIYSALAMEILQSCCVKPWIWYQCICGVVCPLSSEIFFAKHKEFIGHQTDHPWLDLGSAVGFMGRNWRPYFSSTGQYDISADALDPSVTRPSAAMVSIVF